MQDADPGNGKYLNTGFVLRETALKVWKIVAGSCMAVAIAQMLELQYAISTGIITLLTMQDTRKDTIQLTAGI